MTPSTAFPEMLLDDDEALIVSTVSRLGSQHRARPDDAHTWAALHELGFTRLLAPGEDGSPSGSATHALIVVEQLASALCGAPIASAAVLVPDILRHAGLDAAGIEDLIGESPLALMITDDLQSLATIGPAGVAWDAGFAERALCLDGDQVGVVDLGEVVQTADITRTARRSNGPIRLLGLHLDDASRRRIEDLALLTVAADSIGAASALFDEALDYAGQRVQFGHPVGAFQAVQHICGEAYVLLEGMRSALAYATWSYTEAADDAPHAARVAKAYAGTAAVEVIAAATQVFGGIAITWEHDAHRALRRALANRVLFGDQASLHRQLAGTGE